MTRTKRVYVWLTDEEFAQLMKNVKLSGLNRESYLRQPIANRDVRQAPTEGWLKLIHLLSGMANNLNQIARIAHMKDEVSDWEVIRQMEKKLEMLFNWMKNW